MPGPIEGMPTTTRSMTAEDSAELQLLVVMSRRAAPDQVEEVLARLDAVGARGRVAPGTGIDGDRGDRRPRASSPAWPSRGSPGVQQVLPGPSGRTSWCRARRRPSRP